MGAGDRRAAEVGLHTPRTRPAPKDNRQSVRSLLLSAFSLRDPFSLRGRQVLIVRDSQHGRVIGKTVVTVVP